MELRETEEEEGRVDVDVPPALATAEPEAADGGERARKRFAIDSTFWPSVISLRER